jgi:hypothetical protein
MTAVLAFTACEKSADTAPVAALTTAQTTAQTTTQTTAETTTETSTETTAETTVQTSAETATQPALSYVETAEKIDRYMGHFTSVYTMQHMEEYDKSELEETITVESTDVYDMSTEGAELKTYSTGEGKIIRLKFRFYRETGQSEVNIYILDDFIYCTTQIGYYSCFVFARDMTADLLHSTFEEHIVSGDDYYLLDRIGEQLIPTETDPLGENKRRFLP